MTIKNTWIYKNSWGLIDRFYDSSFGRILRTDISPNTFITNFSFVYFSQSIFINSIKKHTHTININIIEEPKFLHHIKMCVLKFITFGF